ncbi:hypothetical protein P9487_07565 [Bacillus cereus]|nr:hypothetical protein [Bacillus cereus]
MGFIVQSFKEFYSNPVGFYLIVALIAMLAFTVCYFFSCVWCQLSELLIF